MEVTNSVSVAAWTDFLDEVPGANVYQSPGLMQVYAQTEGYQPHVVAVEGNHGIQALLAFVIVSYARGPITKFTSRSLVVGGPLGGADAFPALLAALESVASHQTSMSQIRNLSPPQDRAVFEASGYRWQDHLNYIIDLGQGESSLLGGMSKSRRKTLATVDRSGMELVELGSSDVLVVYRLLRESYSRAKVPLAPKSLFENALSSLVPRGQLWCLTATVEGSACAVRLVLRWKGMLYDWYAGSSERGRERHADEWLVWQVLRRGIDEGCTTFDFGGAGSPGEAYGPAEFKRRFGGRRINPGRFEKTYHPLALRSLRAVYGIWRKLPQ